MSQVTTRPVIEVHDAFCMLGTDDGAVVALRGMNLVVHEGERVVIHGPNGSGKTTLLRVLIGDQRLAAGDARVAGWPVGRGPISGVAGWRARHVGWVDQRAGRTLRPELSVADNVALQPRLNGVGRPRAQQMAMKALDLFGVGSLARRRVVDLSGGEAQMVAAAAALVHRPAVVFADEPAGQLDADHAESMYSTLATAVTGIGSALVLVSHDTRASRVADRVVRIRDGRASETWQPAEADELGEGLIVDARGWVRLPAAVRASLGMSATVRVQAGEGSAVLRPAPELDGASAAGHHDADALFRRPAVRPAEEQLDVNAGSPPPVGDVVAQCRRVSRRYGEQTVLDAVSVSFAAGEVHLVRGRSGSGKSTLLRLLVGLDDPDDGEVTLARTPLIGLDRAARAELRRTHVAMVLQDIHLAETATLRDNLSLARAVRGLADDSEADTELLERLGLAALAHREAARCSGGERQRAALARALVGRPSVVVVDEPTSQLDEASAERVIALLVELAESGAAVVVASHDPLVTTAATRIFDLER
jgi:energy-coupling factor transport system ATP-binding protein